METICFHFPRYPVFQSSVNNVLCQLYHKLCDKQRVSGKLKLSALLDFKNLLSFLSLSSNPCSFFLQIKNDFLASQNILFIGVLSKICCGSFITNFFSKHHISGKLRIFALLDSKKGCAVRSFITL